ncbi:MAG: 2-C-methyl-D-erythritol 2,4-cyclodiphosphate synthase [Acidobacteria bacterium]|nr:2-C-methyl-D-erythritol 2,4-cyclodiphosphate synthase [Acidobacteriota bacterium]
MSESVEAFRCGIGYDLHRLAEGRRLLLGGVEIASPRGSVAHSDGDVLSHAIVDALLGAAGLGDIGRHFPDTDPRWKGASSRIFLEEMRRLLATSGLRIVNIDSVIVLDEPKLAPHITAMSENLAAALGIQPSQVSVKAKTSEGTAPAVAAAHAVALIATARGRP